MTNFANIFAGFATVLDMIVAFINLAQGNIGKAIFFLMLAIAVWLICIITPSIREKDNH